MDRVKTITGEDVLEALRLLQEKYPEGVLVTAIRDEFFPTISRSTIAAHLLYGKLLQCHLISQENYHLEVAGGRTWNAVGRAHEDRLQELVRAFFGNQYVLEIQPEKVESSKVESLPPPEPPKESLPPLLIENVSLALESACGSGQTASAQQLQEKFFPRHPVEKVRQLLNYLEETGTVGHIIGDRRAKLYHPAHIWPKKQLDEAIKVTAIKTAPKKVLAFQCEVCQALVGLKAQEGLFTIDCAGCDSSYLSDKGWVYRLGPGIKVQVWTPSGI